MNAPLIHVVDDDAPFRRSLGFVLSANGFDVALHADPAAFLDSFRDDGPAGLICDMRMPGMSGLDVARVLRARGACLPIILITGHADGALVRAAVEAGATAVLEKPFPPQRLIDALTTSMTARWSVPTGPTARRAESQPPRSSE